MANPVTWSAALTRCGYDPDSILYLGTQGGITGIEDLSLVAISGVKDMIYTLNRSASHVLPVAGHVRPSFHYLRERKLTAFRTWIEYRKVRGQVPSSTDFAEAAITRWTARLSELADIKAAGDTITLSVTPKLKDFSTWETWDELFTTHLSHVRNPTLGTPFTYLLRDPVPAQPVQTPAQQRAELLRYAQESVDVDLVATSVHTGDLFLRDNRQLFDLLQSLTIEGTCWTYIERYKAARDGRQAYLQLKLQANGTGAITVKKKRAYEQLANAHFSGRGAFTLEKYVSVHQDSHNKLATVGEPVPETKKVNDFLLGIDCDDLGYAKSAILSDMKLQNDFDACQQYVTSSYTSAKIMKKGKPRHVGAVMKDDTKWKHPKKHKGRRASHPKKPYTGPNRHYTDEEWQALGKEKKDTILAARAKYKAGKKDTAAIKAVETNSSPQIDYTKLAAAMALQGVTVSSVQSHHDEEPVSPTPTANTLELKDPNNAKPTKAQASYTDAQKVSAGSQFGRKGGTSFPKEAVATATGLPPPKKGKKVVIASVMTEASLIPSFSSKGAALAALEAMHAATPHGIAVETDSGTESETEAKFERTKPAVLAKKPTSTPTHKEVPLNTVLTPGKKVSFPKRKSMGRVLPSRAAKEQATLEPATEWSPIRKKKKSRFSKNKGI
jgi:hypothetical protein